MRKGNHKRRDLLLSFIGFKLTIVSFVGDDRVAQL